MSSIQAQDIISIIQEEIENFDWDQTSREVGQVISVGDGIATIYGIDKKEWYRISVVTKSVSSYLAVTI